MRMFLIYYLCNQDLPERDVVEFRSALLQAKCDLRPLEYAKGIKAFTASLDTAPLSNPLPQSKSSFSGLEKMMSTVVEHGVKGLNQVATNFNKMILEGDKMLTVARVVTTLMDQKGSSEILNGYAYFDPRKPKSDGTRAHRTYRQAIVFTVGGGNYVEFQNLKDHAKGGKRLIYGTTDVCSGEEFLAQMGKLSGLHEPGDPSSTMPGSKA